MAHVHDESHKPGRRSGGGGGLVAVIVLVALLILAVVLALAGYIVWDSPKQDPKIPQVVVPTVTAVVPAKPSAKADKCRGGRYLYDLKGVGYTTPSAIRVKKPRENASKREKTFYVDVSKTFYSKPCKGAWVKVQKHTYHGMYAVWVPHHYSIKRIWKHQLSDTVLLEDGRHVTKYRKVCDMNRY